MNGVVASRGSDNHGFPRLVARRKKSIVIFLQCDNFASMLKHGLLLLHSSLPAMSRKTNVYAIARQMQNCEWILDKIGNNAIRSIVGAALFTGRFIDMTLLVACNEIALN